MNTRETEAAIRNIKRGLEVSGLETFSEAKTLQRAVDEHREETDEYVPFTRISPDRSEEELTWKLTRAAHGRTFR